MYVLNTSICNAQNNEVPLQVEHMGDNYRWDDPDSVMRIVEHRPLTTKPNMQSFHLDPLTNLTDVISQGYIVTMGLLVSQTFYDAVGVGVVQAHERYAADVVYRGQTFKYSWLHFIEELQDRIDYSRSEFVVRKPGGAQEPVSVTTAAHLRETRLRLVNTINGGELVGRRIAFLPGTPHFDLCCVHLSRYVFFVSDRVAERLSERRLTGFELVPANVTFE